MASLKEIVMMYQSLKREWDKKPSNLDRCGELLSKLKVLICLKCFKCGKDVLNLYPISKCTKCMVMLGNCCRFIQLIVRITEGKGSIEVIF